MKGASKDWTDSAGWLEGCGLMTGESRATLPATSFWSLYWCDMTFCGVAISQDGGLEQDPNVDLIINMCQSNGFSSVLDPGPPSSTYTCQTADASRCTARPFAVKPPDSTDSTPVSHHPTVVSSKPRGTAQSTDGAEKETTAPAEPTTTPLTRTTSATTSSSAPSHPLTTAATATHIQIGSNAAGVSPSPNLTTTGSPLSAGAKVAIGVGSAVALIALVAAVLLCLYRRKRRTKSPHRSLRTQLRLAQQVPPSHSPTPLISATHSAASGNAPLTPPLRLRDRRFLPSILRPGNRSPSPPLTPLTPAYSPTYSPTTHRLHPGSGNTGVFPASPICSPTTNKLIPRHESAPRVHAGSIGSTHTAATTGTSNMAPHSFPTAMPLPGTANSRGSLSSYGTSDRSIITGTGPSSSLRNEISHQYHMPFTAPSPVTGGSRGQGTATPPGSPTRPPRPHETPLEIPDLVSPASPTGAGPATPSRLGPPPNRSLPPPPPPPPPLPGVMGGNTASFTAVGGRSIVPKGVQVLREGDSEGDSYDPRGSWGSWSGTISGSGVVRDGRI